MASKSTKKDSGGEKKVPVGGYVLRTSRSNSTRAVHV